jgi:hypothetical protein
MQFDDIAIPGENPVDAIPEDMDAHQTPVTPPWRRAPDRPPVRSQQQEFADHLSTDSFAAQQAPRRPAPASAHATTDLPQREAPKRDAPKRDVPRAADRAPAVVRPGRPQRPAETETSLVEPAAGEGGGAWGDYTDPKSVDLQAEAGGGWEQPQTGAVRVRGPVGGWEETRRSREPHPVTDRRKKVREPVQTLSNRSLVAGSLCSLFLLVVIGYLVHALL